MISCIEISLFLYRKFPHQYPDYIASTVFDLVSLAGISGTTWSRVASSAWLFRPRSWPLHWPRMVAPRSRRSRPGAVPDYCFTVDGRRMLYDVKRISFCPSRYWPTVAVSSSRGVRLSTGHPSFVRSTRRQLPRSMPGQYPDSGLVQTDGYRRPSRSTDGSRYPRLVPSGSRLGLRQHCFRGVQGGRRLGVLLAQAASSSAQRQWRSLGARSMLDARSFMISTLRSQVGFAAAVAHARLRLSRLELIGGSGRTAGRYAGDGDFPILFGYISYRIRIVLYLNVF